MLALNTNQSIKGTFVFGILNDGIAQLHEGMR